MGDTSLKPDEKVLEGVRAVLTHVLLSVTGKVEPLGPSWGESVANPRSLPKPRGVFLCNIQPSLAFTPHSGHHVVTWCR